MQFDVDLKPLEHDTLRGKVCDEDGTPLEGVTISAYEESVQTTRDGTFALPRVLGRPGHPRIPPLTFSKDGYVTWHEIGSDFGKDDVEVVLKRQVPLEGLVLGPDGQPVHDFMVRAWPIGQSGLSPRWHTAGRVIKDSRGRFKLMLDWGGSTWLAVRADGFANREVRIEVTPGGGKLVVRLEAGVTVRGKILLPPGTQNKVTARLVARPGAYHHERSLVMDWSGVATPVAPDGTFRFEHVRPDRYKLGLDGPGVTPRLLAVDIPAGGLDLGQIRLFGRGRICRARLRFGETRRLLAVLRRRSPVG